MKKYILKVFSLILAVVMGMSSFGAAFAAKEIPEGYTPIYTAEDLNNIRNNLSGKYILMNDIDLSVYENWEPIGNADAPFTGELDGNGYSISSMKINAECNENKTYYWGLFGYIRGTVSENQHTIKNLSITDASVNINCFEETVAKSHIGVLVGFCSSSSVFNCVIAGEVFVEGFSVSEVGGVIGRCNLSSITGCVNYANLNITGTSNSSKLFVGGITGNISQSGEKYCCNYGDIFVRGSEITQSCVAKIGGIDGEGSNNISLTDSYNRGDISVDFSTIETYVGGVSGESKISVNTYNSGKIVCPEDFEGYSGAISGNIYSDWLAIGAPEKLENAYYIDPKMIPAYNGESIPNDFTSKPFINVKLLTEEEFKKQESFAGFDFENVWMMEEGGYPVLRNQSEISLAKSVELEIGDTYDVKAISKKWSSTDNNIAVINEQGEISALTAGTAIITIECFYGYTIEYTVTVPEQEKPTTAPSTEPTEPNENPQDTCPLADFWIVKHLKQVWKFVVCIVLNALSLVKKLLG